MHASTLLSSALLAAYATAAVVDVDVGEDGLEFSPNSVTAAVGDT